MLRRPPRSTRTATLFPYTTLFPSHAVDHPPALHRGARRDLVGPALDMLVVLYLQGLAGVIGKPLGEQPVPRPDRHVGDRVVGAGDIFIVDRKSTRLNSSH